MPGTMNPQAIPQALRPLIGFLDSLTERAPVDELRQLLASSQVTRDDLRGFVRFGTEQYQRNLVAAGRWYEVLVICWRSGQRSPIHDHAQSTCGLKVLSGTCSETLFSHAACGQVVALSTRDRHVGEICVSEDADTHQVSNLQAAGNDLVTLHIYSPPLRRMKRFSITGSQAEDWCPAVHEFVHGEGI
jgi:cysteine dioxygenase